MATDQTPPRNGLILVVTIVCVGLLIVIKPVLDLYYDVMMRGREHAAIATQPAYQLNRLRSAARASLTEGRMPIDRAVEALSRGRMASPAITPEPSNDGAAIVGWSRLPAYVSTANKDWSPPPPPPPPPVVEAPAAEATP